MGGCFAFGTAPFATHQSDCERAAEYLRACIKEKLSWEKVVAQIRDYLSDKGANEDYIRAQIARAQDRIRPWLGEYAEESDKVRNL